MKLLTNQLVKKIAGNRDLLKPAERHRIGLIESWSSIFVNIFLTLLKVIFALLTNSIALFADAVHSTSDILSSMVVLLGFTLSRKKADREHPHGHGRTEYLAGLIMGVMLIGVALLFIYNAYVRLTEEIFASPSIASIVAIIIALLTKEFMFRFSVKLGELIESEVLVGDAWHHRSDAITSVLVLVALIGGYLGYPHLDAYLGLAVSLFILYAGIKILRRSCSRLIGKAPTEELQQKVLKCASEIEGVVDAHDLEIHDYGSWKVVTIHIAVNGQLSLDEAHLIASRVEDYISDCCHCDTTVHLDPD